MKIHLAQPLFTDFRPYEVEVLPKIRKEFMGSQSCRDAYTLVGNPEAADFILFFESATYKTESHIANLLREPLVQRFPEKLLTYNFQDAAAGFLDGVYVHTERRRFRSGHHLAWSTLWPHNELIYEITDEKIAATVPEQVCAFRGSISSPLRRRLFEYFSARPSRAINLELIDRWYNHQPDEKQRYVDDILNARFVLCPRGICSYTPRFFETMALGRTPVLMADDWVPPENLDLSAVAVVVPERDIDHLVEIIRLRERDASELGRNGRRYWKRHFSRETRLRALLDTAAQIMQRRLTAPSLERYRDCWSSFAFRWSNDWTLPQRFRRKLKRICRPPRGGTLTKIV